MGLVPSAALRNVLQKRNSTTESHHEKLTFVVIKRDLGLWANKFRLISAYTGRGVGESR